MRNEANFNVVLMRIDYTLCYIAQALCEHNPDKHLKDAYHPERTRRPHPQPLEGPVRETVHSLQRPPLHAEEQG